MKVSVDSAADQDLRFRLLGRLVGRHRRHVLGDCVMVWAACFAQRSDVLDGDLIDELAELAGFASAMSKAVVNGCGLAVELPEGKFRIAGVAARMGRINQLDHSRPNQHPITDPVTGGKCGPPDKRPLSQGPVATGHYRVLSQGLKQPPAARARASGSQNPDQIPEEEGCGRRGPKASAERLGAVDLATAIRKLSEGT